MLKLEIKMDEEKIRAEKKYSVESIYQALQQAFSKYKFNQMQDADGTMSFTGNGNPKDYDGENENDYTIEDVLYHYTKRLSVA